VLVVQCESDAGAPIFECRPRPGVPSRTTQITLSGNVFVTDISSSTLSEVLAPAYTTVKTLACGFGFPLGVALDADGNAFVADAGNVAVYEVVKAGGYKDMIALGSGWSMPTGVAVDASGNVYIADQNFAAVQEIAASSGYSTVSPVGPSSFSEPDAVVIDASGHLFVADFGTGAVYEVAAAGGYNTTSTLISGVGDSNSGSALPLPCDRTGAQWTIRLRVFSQVTARRAVEATQSDIPAGFARATGREGGLWKKLSIFERRPLRSATHAKHKTRSPGAAILPRRPGIIREKP